MTFLIEVTLFVFSIGFIIIRLNENTFVCIISISVYLKRFSKYLCFKFRGWYYSFKQKYVYMYI